MVLLLCSECGHEQSEGMFCGLCGGKLVPKESAVGVIDGQQRSDGDDELVRKDSGPSDVRSSGQFGSSDEQGEVDMGQQQATSESFDRVVETSKEFGSFFQQFMKTPSQALGSGVQQFSHAIINLVLLTIIFSVTVYRLTKVVFTSILFDHGSYVFQSFLTIVVSMLVVIVVMFGLNKFFGDESISFQRVTSIYGVFMVPAVIVGVVAFVFALIKNTEYAGYFLALLFLLMVLIIPLFMAGYFVMNFRKNIDPLYAFLLYVVVSFLALAIVHGIVLRSITGEFVDYLAGLISSLVYLLS